MDQISSSDGILLDQWCFKGRKPRNLKQYNKRNSSIFIRVKVKAFVDHNLKLGILYMSTFSISNFSQIVKVWFSGEQLNLKKKTVLSNLVILKVLPGQINLISET